MDLRDEFLPSVSGQEGQIYVHRDIHIVKPNIRGAGLVIQPLLYFSPSLRV